MFLAFDPEKQTFGQLLLCFQKCFGFSLGRSSQPCQYYALSLSTTIHEFRRQAAGELQQVD
jgi:hypothetical protein